MRRRSRVKNKEMEEKEKQEETKDGSGENSLPVGKKELRTAERRENIPRATSRCGDYLVSESIIGFAGCCAMYDT